MKEEEKVLKLIVPFVNIATFNLSFCGLFARRELEESSSQFVSQKVEKRKIEQKKERINKHANNE